MSLWTRVRLAWAVIRGERYLCTYRCPMCQCAAPPADLFE